MIAGWLITGFYRVNTDQQGVALLFGQLTARQLHYNIPAPIGDATADCNLVNRVSRFPFVNRLPVVRRERAGKPDADRR